MTLVVTQVGLDKATQADVQGVNLKITHVAVGLNGYTPDNTKTALQNEFARVAISGGKNINDNQVHLTAMFEGEGEINGREIGFYLEDGTLFAIDSHPTDIILYKSATTGARALEGFDLVLDGVPPNSITVDITGDIVINFDN
jgi:phage-related tail fiber protein